MLCAVNSVVRLLYNPNVVYVLVSTVWKLKEKLSAILKHVIPMGIIQIPQKVYFSILLHSSLHSFSRSLAFSSFIRSFVRSSVRPSIRSFVLSSCVPSFIHPRLFYVRWVDAMIMKMSLKA